MGSSKKVDAGQVGRLGHAGFSEMQGRTQKEEEKAAAGHLTMWGKITELHVS